MVNRHDDEHEFHGKRDEPYFNPVAGTIFVSLIVSIILALFG